jgi:hypothetical protein
MNVVHRREEVRDPYDQLCWLYSPVCLEWRAEAKEGVSSFRLLAELARRMGRALARVLS